MRARGPIGLLSRANQPEPPLAACAAAARRLPNPLQASASGTERGCVAPAHGRGAGQPLGGQQPRACGSRAEPRLRLAAPQISVVVSAHNTGAKAMNLSAIVGSINSPEKYDMFIQNFTIGVSRRFHVVIYVGARCDSMKAPPCGVQSACKCSGVLQLVRKLRRHAPHGALGCAVRRVPLGVFVKRPHIARWLLLLAAASWHACAPFQGFRHLAGCPARQRSTRTVNRARRSAAKAARARRRRPGRRRPRCPRPLAALDPLPPPLAGPAPSSTARPRSPVTSHSNRCC